MFDAVSKKSLVQRIFTLMTGSVVTQAGGGSGTANKGKRAKSQAKVKPAKKAKAGPKAKAGNLVQVPECPPEAGIDAPTVSVAKGVRSKLWIDDAVRAVNHTVSWLRSVDAYSEVEQDIFDELKKHLIRQLLLFAFQGSLLLSSARGGKLHRRWSTLRPALPGHAVHWLSKQAGHISQNQCEVNFSDDFHDFP